MDFVRRLLILGVFFVTCTGALVASQGAAPAATPRLTSEEMEAFLLKAKVANKRDAGSGVTGSSRVTLSDGRLTHDAHVQAVDIARPVFEAGKATELNFKDTYRYNIAGYRLARLVGLDIVPMSVARHIDGKMAAVTWWVDDVMMDEEGPDEEEDDGAGRPTLYQADSGHEDLGRADSEQGQEPGQPPVDQRLDAVVDRSYACISAGQEAAETE